MRNYLFIIALLITVDAAAVEPFQGVFRIGAASKVGTFYKAADKICQIANRHDRTYCVPVVTNGSLHNLNLLVAGKLDFAVVKSDIVLALDEAGLSDKSRRAIDQVQVIARLHNMPLTMIGPASGPSQFTYDVARNYRINIGLEGSGERIATRELFQAMGINLRQVSTTTFNSKLVVDAFCDDQTDIVIELIAHPAAIYNQLINDCGGRMLNVSPLIVAEVSAINPLVRPALVYEGFYSGSARAYDTYAVHAYLIANRDLNDELRHFIGDSIAANFGTLQQQLPEWIDLNLSDLALDNPPEFRQ